MDGFTFLDLIAIIFFVASWIGYHAIMETDRYGAMSLNAQMHRFRRGWMAEMLHRERIVDTQIIAALQNGTAFFASTSLIAIGGAIALLRAADDVLKLFADLPFGLATTRMMWEMKVAGIVLIFVYAFFKFAWSYRLFNYVAILLGATPPILQADTDKAKRHAAAMADVITDAGKQFNRGQRAFFFALAYVGWFISPFALIAMTAFAVSAMLLRQFNSASHHAIAKLDQL